MTWLTNTWITLLNIFLVKPFLLIPLQVSRIIVALDYTRRLPWASDRPIAETYIYTKYETKQFSKVSKNYFAFIFKGVHYKRN